MSDLVKTKLSATGSVTRRNLGPVFEIARDDPKHGSQIVLDRSQDVVSGEDESRCEPLIDAAAAAAILGIHVSCYLGPAARETI